MSNFSFSDENVQKLLASVRRNQEVPSQDSKALEDGGRLCLFAECIKLTINNGKACLVVPLGVGEVCLPVPNIYDGDLASACLHICTTWGIPTGVKVTVSINGQDIVSRSYGNC